MLPFSKFIFINLNLTSDKFLNVLRVVNGETIKVEKIGKTRLIRVDTPELTNPKKAVRFFIEKAAGLLKNIRESQRLLFVILNKSKL